MCWLLPDCWASPPVGAVAASPHAGFLPRLLAAVALYCLLGCLMDFPATVAISTTGLAISPHFDQPYASESMASFWGRRWNVATSNTLRSLIYDPIYEGTADHLTRRGCLQGYILAVCKAMSLRSHW